MKAIAGISVPDLDVKSPACEYTPQAGLFLWITRQNPAPLHSQSIPETACPNLRQRVC
jgi:hypothetical protein